MNYLIPKKCRSNFWLHTLVLKQASKNKKNKLLSKFHKNKILARPIWSPFTAQLLKKYPKMNLKNADLIENKIINIPSSSYL